MDNDPNLPKHVRGWLKNKKRQGRKFQVPPGYELAHRKGCEADCGFGYEFADPKWRRDHVSFHRFWRKRSGK